MVEIAWSTDSLRLRFAVDAGGPVALVSLRTAGHADPGPDDPGPDDPRPDDPGPDDARDRQPLVELTTIDHGRFPGGFRHVDSTIGARLRYGSHESGVRAGAQELRIRQQDPVTGLRVTSVFRAHDRVAAFQTWTEVETDDETGVVVDFVSSFATDAFLLDWAVTVDDLDLAHAANDWLAESRWRTDPVRAIGLARVDTTLHGNPPRSRIAVTNRGSWSTGEQLPTGVLLARDGSSSLAWQIEHNGPWLYELGETVHAAYLLLSGPTDQEHQWSVPVTRGRPFRSVTASVGVADGGLDAAMAVLTDQRRAIRMPRDIDRTLPVVFNDYMNTLMGDPTTAKLLPLVDAAAEVGADVFCIDAGWYAEGHWWDTVGEWRPSASRFPNGIDEVIDHIRSKGMTAGLWLEPEVVGVRSPLARTLPDDAFFSRHGTRVAEHGRHLLDLRSPAAVAHLDEVVDRLVGDHGVGFFKMDCNTMTGPGTDSRDDAAGAGLLEHNRALLAWLDAVQARHPTLLIESCASGAMRMDYAMLQRLHLQSTSDQQDPLQYASIAASAPASILPEQAGNWAYPERGMPRERLVLSLVNGVLGRMYLSGYLNRMTDAQLATIREAIAAQREVLAVIERTHPVWPLGLPGWDDPWVALGLASDEALDLAVWRLGGAASAELPLPRFRGRDLDVAPLFPRDSGAWSWHWDRTAGVLSASADPTVPSARVVRIRTH